MTSKQTTLSGEIQTHLVNQKRTDDWDIDVGRADYGDSHLLNTEVGEPGWLGNPYALSDGYSREEFIQRYREDFHERLETDEEFRKAVEDLHGETLACYCKPDACHGDVIIEYLHQPDKQREQS